MTEAVKTKEQLITDLEEMRQRVAELEALKMINLLTLFISKLMMPLRD